MVLKPWLIDEERPKSVRALLRGPRSLFLVCVSHKCGRIMSAEGYHMDPARLDGLKDMSPVRTAAELSRFIYCCRWMSTAIPNLCEHVAKLTAVLDEASSKDGKRTTREVHNIALSSLS